MLRLASLQGVDDLPHAALGAGDNVADRPADNLIVRAADVAHGRRAPGDEAHVEVQKQHAQGRLVDK